jgi:hypothetical protein
MACYGMTCSLAVSFSPRHRAARRSSTASSPVNVALPVDNTPATRRWALRQLRSALPGFEVEIRMRRNLPAPLR